jgi:CubicO group peptidase (beta-lactamase class C family)
MKRRTLLKGMILLTGATSELSAAVDATQFDRILSQWDRDEHADLQAVVVMRKGEVIAERYFNGATRRTLNDVRSAGKSITSLLLGAALDRGLIHTMSDPVQRYWHEAGNSAIGDVSLANILSMRSGLAAFDEQAGSPGSEDRLDEASDPPAFALSVPRVHAPGAVYNYNSLTAYIAGLVIEKAANQRLADFARSALFGPLGIERWEWATDVKGHTKGQGNLSLTARDFATIGQMVLKQGLHGGHRVLSAGWIAESLKARVSIGSADPYADGYGYFWYHKTHQIADRRVAVSFASGNGGNKIYVVPSEDLVVAITSRAYGRGYGQRRSEDILKALL